MLVLHLMNNMRQRSPHALKGPAQSGSCSVLMPYFIALLCAHSSLITPVSLVYFQYTRTAATLVSFHLSLSLPGKLFLDLCRVWSLN